MRATPLWPSEEESPGESVCEKCVYRGSVCEVWAAAGRRPGAVVWHWFVKGDNTAHWPAPAPLSAAHTSPCSLNTSTRLPQGGEGGEEGEGGRDTGCFDNESERDKEAERRLEAKTLMNKVKKRKKFKSSTFPYFLLRVWEYKKIWRWNIKAATFRLILTFSTCQSETHF